MERQQWMKTHLQLHYVQGYSRGAACKQLGQILYPTS